MPVARGLSYAVATGPVPTKALGVKVSAALGVTSFSHPEIASFVNILRTSPEQKRASLRCDPALMKAAQAKALDMATRKYAAHVDPDGRGMNYHARQAGYILPQGYGIELPANNIESISAGATGGVRTWQSWMDSSKHKMHLAGIDPFFQEQTDFGIGRAEVAGSPYTFYWVFLSSRPA